MAGQSFTCAKGHCGYMFRIQHLNHVTEGLKAEVDSVIANLQLVDQTTPVPTVYATSQVATQVSASQDRHPETLPSRKLEGQGQQSLPRQIARHRHSVTGREVGAHATVQPSPSSQVVTFRFSCAEGMPAMPQHAEPL